MSNERVNRELLWSMTNVNFINYISEQENRFVKETLAKIEIKLILRIDLIPKNKNTNQDKD